MVLRPRQPSAAIGFKPRAASIGYGNVALRPRIKAVLQVCTHGMHRIEMRVAMPGPWLPISSADKEADAHTPDLEVVDV